MKLSIRKSDERGATSIDWLQSRHSFSFGDYHDPAWMGFGKVRVLNDDVIAGGGGFGKHPHRDMEILTWVLSGALQHRDSLGHEGVIVPGMIQTMTAGTGIRHSEFNASPQEPVHLLQTWILPRDKDLPPRYDQATFAPEARAGRWCLVASPDGRDGSARIEQDATMWVANLGKDATLEYDLGEGRCAWLHVARGSAAVNAQALSGGDAAGVEGPGKLSVRGADGGAELVLIDTPDGLS